MEVRKKHASKPRTHVSKAKLKHINLLQRIIHCDHCGRPLRIQTVSVENGKKYGYYQEASKMRGLECEFSSKVVRMKVAEDQVFDFLSNLRLPEDWQNQIRQKAEDMDIVREIESRKAKIDDDLRRIGRAYVDRVFTESEYENRRTKLLNEKASLVIPDGAKVIEIGLRLESLQEFLEYATDDEKYQILHILFDFVNYDFKQAKIVCFKPKAEFAEIFRLAVPLTGWHEVEGSIFDLAQNIVDTQN